MRPFDEPVCPGSLRPIPFLRPGDEIDCEFCARRVRLTAPPLAGLHDPWRGSTDARIEAHAFARPGQAR